MAHFSHWDAVRFLLRHCALMVPFLTLFNFQNVFAMWPGFPS
jgi:hypothetical protein